MDPIGGYPRRLPGAGKLCRSSTDANGRSTSGNDSHAGCPGTNLHSRPTDLHSKPYSLPRADQHSHPIPDSNPNAIADSHSDPDANPHVYAEPDPSTQHPTGSRSAAPNER